MRTYLSPKRKKLYNVEKKGCFSKSEILEFSKRAASMLKTMSKIKVKNISVQKDSTQQKIEEYGVEITKIPFEKKLFPFRGMLESPFIYAYFLMI